MLQTILLHCAINYVCKSVIFAASYLERIRVKKDLGLTNLNIWVTRSTTIVQICL